MADTRYSSISYVASSVPIGYLVDRLFLVIADGMPIARVWACRRRCRDILMADTRYSSISYVASSVPIGYVVDRYARSVPVLKCVQVCAIKKI